MSDFCVLIEALSSSLESSSSRYPNSSGAAKLTCSAPDLVFVPSEVRVNPKSAIWTWNLAFNRTLAYRKGSVSLDIVFQIEYPAEVSMNYVFWMDVLKAHSHLQYLPCGVSIHKKGKDRKPYTLFYLSNWWVCVFPPLGQSAILHVRWDEEELSDLFIFIYS